MHVTHEKLLIKIESPFSTNSPDNYIAMFELFRRNLTVARNPAQHGMNSINLFWLTHIYRGWTPDRLQVGHWSVATNLKFIRNWDSGYWRQHLTKVRSRKWEMLHLWILLIIAVIMTTVSFQTFRNFPAESVWGLWMHPAFWWPKLSQKMHGAFLLLEGLSLSMRSFICVVN